MRAISLLLLPCVALALTTTTQGPRLAATSPAASRRSVGPLAVEAEDPLAKATCTKKAELVAANRAPPLVFGMATPQLLMATLMFSTFVVFGRAQAAAAAAPAAATATLTFSEIMAKAGKKVRMRQRPHYNRGPKPPPHPEPTSDPAPDSNEPRPLLTAGAWRWPLGPDRRRGAGGLG